MSHWIRSTVLCFALQLVVHNADAQQDSPVEPQLPPVELLKPKDLANGEVVGFHPRIHRRWIGAGGLFQNEAIRRGSLHLFERQDGSWRHAQRLVSPTLHREGDTFGSQFALGDDIIAVGDYAAELDGKIVGAVHLYELDEGAWRHTQTLHMAAPRHMAGFGAWVDIEGDTLVVGEAHELMVGGWGDNRAVHVFERKPEGWRAAAVIVRPATLVVTPEKREKAQREGMSRHAGFGAHFDLAGDRLVVSAMGADALLVYRREQDRWRLVQRIDDPGIDSAFARTVAMSGSTLVVAALRGNGRSADTGVAHVYREQDGRWSLAQTLSLPNGNAQDMFGHWVAIDDGTILVGAHQRLMSAGLAYAYKQSGTQWTLAAVLNPPDGWRRRMSAYSVDIDAGTAVLNPGNELLVGGPLAAPGSGGVYVAEIDSARYDEQGS